jgi:dTDP-4-amino-4,6-dideoxygalactose transaminase
LTINELEPEAEPIYVMRPTMPDPKAYGLMLEEIWRSRWLTNNGKFHDELERALSSHLKVPNISLVGNGTLAVLLALRAAGIRGGSVVTTPFTFPATTHCLEWLGARPIFADVDPTTGNVDPHSVRERVAPDTTAILAVHVYGRPCDHEALQKIARDNKLKLVYDAAHAFGVEVDGQSILTWGDASAISFHATKLFSTVEGGAVIVPNKENKGYVDRLKNFGIVDEETVREPGINARMNELQAAFGLLRLGDIGQEIAGRRAVAAIYDSMLSQTAGIHIITRDGAFTRNYAYYAIRVDGDEAGVSRDAIHDALKRQNVLTRKYFHPIVSSTVSYAHLPTASRRELPVAYRLDEQVLCLPMYGSLDLDAVRRICIRLKTIIANARQPAAKSM